MITYYASPATISVKLEAVASPEEEEAARKLIEYLAQSEQAKDGQPAVGGGGKPASQP